MGRHDVGAGRRVVRWIAALALLVVTCSAQAGEYRLGLQDKVRIEVYEYPAVDGEYEVGAAGTVALPLVGEVAADGATPGELAERINARLAGLSRSAAGSSASVQVTEYRPIFILGDVQRPGPYPFQPGLRMVQALALAGGVYRPQDLGALRISRDAIAAAGLIEVLEARALGLSAERARLEAELSGADAVSFPDEVARPAPDAGAASEVIERQAALFAVRREAFAKQSGTLGRLIRSLKAEMVSLDRQDALKARQIATVEEELVSARALIAQGLAPQTRGLELERLAADIGSDRQEVTTQKLRARQAITRTEQSLLSLSDERRSQAAAALHDVDEALRETRAEIATQGALLRDALAAAPLAGFGPLEASGVPLGYAVARFSGEATAHVQASEDDPVEPGDVVTVRFQPAAVEGVAAAR